MPSCFFATDIHGDHQRYRTLFATIEHEQPDAVFLGGDLLPTALTAVAALDPAHRDFVNGYLAPQLRGLKDTLAERYPRIFVILGNDDGRRVEASMLDAAAHGLWEYIHDRHSGFEGYSVYGYSYIPPTPFQLKDWERYDVSRYVDPGCISPEEGYYSTPVSDREKRYATIKEDLNRLVGDDDLTKSILLFHTPPYKTRLDHAALDGKTIDYVPLDPHIGSIAVQRLIEARQPLITLHGHVHESTEITGKWHDRIGRTHLFSAAHNGKELCLVRFDPNEPEAATRELL